MLKRLHLFQGWEQTEPCDPSGAAEVGDLEESHQVTSADISPNRAR